MKSYVWNLLYGLIISVKNLVYYWKYDNLVEFLMWLEILVIEMICFLVIVIIFFNIIV